MRKLDLEHSLKHTDYIAIGISSDEMTLVEAALGHIRNLSYDLLDEGAGVDDHAVLSRIVDDWQTEWSNRIQRATPFAFGDLVELVKINRPSITLTRCPDSGNFNLICKHRYQNQLDTILHAGQDWAESDSCMLYVAQNIAFMETGAPFLSNGAMRDPRVAAGVSRIQSVFPEMREALSE